MKRLILAIAAALLTLGVGRAQTLETVLSTGLSEPYAVAVDVNNTYYVADSANNRILKYFNDNNTTTNIAGLAGSSGKGYVDGPGHLARFFNPQGIVAVRDGLAIADSGNQRIRLMSTNGIVTTLAGSGSVGSADGAGTTASFNFPAGLAADAAGNIYVADLGNNSIRKIDTANNVTTIATGFFRPSGVTVGEGGRLFVADSGNHSIMTFVEGQAPTVFAGSGSRFFSGNKDSLIATNALFNNPRGLHWVGGTNQVLLVADSANKIVRRLYTNAVVGNISVETIASTAVAGLVNPVGITRDRVGSILIVDVGGGTLRRINATDAQVPVPSPRIGYVELVEDQFTGSFRSKLTVVSSGVFNNSIVVAIASEVGTETFYTVDGQEPNASNGLTPPPFREGDVSLPSPILDQSRAGASSDVTVKAIGTAVGRRSSDVVSARFQFQVANPAVIGNNPISVGLESLTANALLYYTTDGSEPTQASSLYVTGSRLNISNGTNDVTLKVRGFRNGFQPSRIVSQVFIYENVVTSTVGIPRDFNAGVGSKLVVPVQLNLAADDVLKSLQFRVEVKPIGAAPALPRAPVNLTINPDVDFVPLPAPTTNFFTGVFTRDYTDGTATGLLVGYLTTNSAFSMTASGTAAVLQIPMPLNAAEGDKYSIEVLFPSGTSDGLSTPVVIRPLVARTITITNIAFIAGDTAGSTWYNAGEFGNGNLNNNDVNNAFYASVGVRVPYAESDAFHAMNVFGADLAIGIEDWQLIFDRSLRVNTNNVVLKWSAGGFLASTPTELGSAANTAGEVLAQGSAGAAWTANATLSGKTMDNIQPGQTVDVPVTLDIVGGQTISALQFRATIQAPKGSGRFLGPVTYTPAAGIPGPTFSFNGDGTVAMGWPMGSFKPALAGKVALGSIRFNVPGDAKEGDAYVVRFQHAGALYAKEGFLFGSHNVQSLPSAVWVLGPAQSPPDIISDEWRAHFFGRLDNLLSGPFEDPDGDGKNNLQEFLQGSNPAKLLLHRLDSDWKKYQARGGFKLRWFAGEGKTYVVESSVDLTAWTTVATIKGLGDLREFVAENTPDPNRFYRVREVAAR